MSASADLLQQTTSTKWLQPNYFKVLTWVTNAVEEGPKCSEHECAAEGSHEANG
jgi:hypothetical protein